MNKPQSEYIPYGDFNDRTPDMFDFPCSDTFRGYYNAQFGHESVLSSRFVTSRLPERQQSSQEMPSDLNPLRVAIRENREIKALVRKMESDVSGLKKGYHTHLDKKKQSFRNQV